MSNEAVSLRRDGAGPLPRLAAERARKAVPVGAVPELTDALQAAQDLGPWLPLPMQGDTLSLWESLASLGAVDLTVGVRRGGGPSASRRLPAATAPAYSPAPSPAARCPTASATRW